MPKRKIPHICITCKFYRPNHCEINHSYVGYLYAEKENGCKAWQLSDDYKNGGKFYELKDGEQDENVSKLTDAIETIKAECASHKRCESCDFYGETKRCKFTESVPEDWDMIKDGDSDG